MSESQSALYLMALTAPMLIFPSVAALLTRWFSPGRVSTGGLMMASVGLLLLGDAFHSNHLSQLVLALILCGAGAALPGADGRPGDIRCAGGESRYGGRPVQHRSRCRRGDRPGDSLRGINGKQYPDPAESRSRVYPEVIHRAAGWLGAGNMPQAAALLPDFSLRALRGL